MNTIQAIHVLRQWDRLKRYVFTHHDLRKLFLDDQLKTFTKGIRRLVNEGLLIHACRGVYVNPHALSFDHYTIEHIAKALRRGQYNYISLESILSEYGVISQIPLDRLTIMTTGRSGVYKTPYGIIEFTHTKRSYADILAGTKQLDNRPLRIAAKQIAWRDLKRVGRNINMVNIEELDDEL